MMCYKPSLLLSGSSLFMVNKPPELHPDGSKSSAVTTEEAPPPALPVIVLTVLQ